MNALLIVGFALSHIVLVAPCLAGLPPPPKTLAELVPWSELIVVGTLSEVSEESREGLTNGHGILHVSKPLWGQVDPGAQLRLEWSTLSDFRTGPTHASRANVEGLWLLQDEPDGTVRALEPDGFQVISQLEAVQMILQQRLRARISPYAIGAVLEIGLRNASLDTLVVPGIRVETPCLVLDPAIYLSVSTWGGEGLRPKQSRLRHDSRVLPLTVPPGEDRLLRVQLTDVYPLVDRKDYGLRLFIPGSGDTLSMRVHVNP